MPQTLAPLSRLTLRITALAGLVLLAGCSSGGGSTEPPSAPALTLTPQSIKTFHFSWTDVADETEYRLLENPDGSAGYTQVASIAADATGHDLEVFLPGRINAGYILQACNSGGCTDSGEVFVSGSLAGATGYVKASNTDAEDYFGNAVALSADGDTLAVGASGEASATIGIDGDPSDNSADLSGAVYLFTRTDTGGWSQQAYVKASNTDAKDRFGTSVALSADGDTLAVGATWEDSAATGIGGNQSDNSLSGSGAVYLFTRTDAGGWSQQAYVKASNPDSEDLFGYSVALAGDGNTLAVGAHLEDSSGTESDNSADGSGAVYLFTRTDTGGWSQQAYVKASNTNAGDHFGATMALSADGNTLAVGANGEDSAATGIDGDESDNSASGSGAVYLFTRTDAGVWSQQAYVKASNTDASDLFGTLALSGDGDTLAVGAYLEDSSATGLGGDPSDNSADGSGAVYLFTRTDTEGWSQQAYVKASNTEANDRFGGAVALSDDGDTLAVAGILEDSAATGIGGNQSDNSALDSGAVYLFTRTDTGWAQQAYVKASNTEAKDWYALEALALSGDARTLAVGAYGEDSAATGLDGDQSDNTADDSGAVYLY